MGYHKQYKWKPKPLDYEKFRDALEFDFEDAEIDSKEALSELMQIKGYHKAWNREERITKNEYPSQPQLDFAWNVLKGKIKVEKFYIEDEEGKRRASIDTYVRGKLYKKGQYIPITGEENEES